ncbi:energy-coupling factor transporter transmembrane protein EcfT [Ruegeria sediminis]|uniref:Energy-coupling factor transporter transmembrane protein EcfT n=1 Tax=Ruegeria sediminis TaxID=2583820 RepID=A0ABY2WU76_9RHOB|nr:CbiQ family ECF transporter T component [Ruegeria sediminis]TMV05570.1 energy-coupling factor transporter transmembrane protein EcfT [Ruegeria sediminis]
MLSLTSPVKTRYHRLPAAAKLLALSLATFLLFVIETPVFVVAVLLATALLYAVPGRAFWTEGLRLLRPVVFFVAVVLVWHIVTNDVATGIMICLRLVAAVALANLVTMTTRLEDMLDVVRKLFAPFRRFGLSPDVLAFSVALVVRFAPVLLEKGTRLAEAWRARSARRARWNIILPLTLIVLDDADHVSEALRARGGVETTY